MHYLIALLFIIAIIYHKFNALQTGIAIAIPSIKKALSKNFKTPGGHNEKVSHDV